MQTDEGVALLDTPPHHAPQLSAVEILQAPSSKGDSRACQLEAQIFIQRWGFALNFQIRNVAFVVLKELLLSTDHGIRSLEPPFHEPFPIRNILTVTITR